MRRTTMPAQESRKSEPKVEREDDKYRKKPSQAKAPDTFFNSNSFMSNLPSLSSWLTSESQSSDSPSKKVI